MKRYRVALHVESWRDYEVGNPGRGWFGYAPSDPPRVVVRRWIAWIPILGLRVLRHELEHLVFADFDSTDEHHDSPKWAAANGAQVHECGRATNGFLTMFRTAHLQTPAAPARILREKGHVEIEYEPGSAIDQFLRRGEASA